MSLQNDSKMLQVSLFLEELIYNHCARLLDVQFNLSVWVLLFLSSYICNKMDFYLFNHSSQYFKLY